MTSSSFSFSREEHLKSRKRIANLFAEGRAVKSFPLRAQFNFVEALDNRKILQIGFVVSKRSFKNAVDRNRIKRQMIEVFRLNRERLMQILEEESCYVDVMLIFVHREHISFEQLVKAWTKLESKLIDEIHNHKRQ